MSSSLPIGPADRIAGPYTATAGQTAFTFAFPLLEAADLKVETAAAATPDMWVAASLGTDYSVSGALPLPAGGSIVFTSGRAAGTRVRILGAAVIANTQDPLPAGRVDSSLLNRFFDRVTMWAQELRRDVQTLTLGAAAHQAWLTALQAAQDTLQAGLASLVSSVQTLTTRLDNIDGTAAEEASQIAVNAAASATVSAAQASLYEGFWRSTVATVLADTVLTYTAGSPSSVTTSSYVLTRAEGFAYKVAASGASDHHVVTAGGVKLYVQPRDGEFQVEAFGVSLGQTGNIAAVSKYLTARSAILKVPLLDRVVPQPKLHLISAVSNGKSSQAFPAAVRHDGADYIIYREGLGHVESLPIGTKVRMVCTVRDVNGIAPSSTTTIYSANNIDPRDTSILRDDFGNAILVGGVFKVVTFLYDSAYSAAGISAKVFDLDPTNLAAGYVNPVTLPLPIQAVKSDVRQLDSGDYAFVGYSLDGKCHLVTTADWATFTTEEIGPGNEAAFCQTQDGELNVIVRAEEQFGAAAAIFYKKKATGGWYVHDILPNTLNCPTLVKGRGIRGFVSVPEGNEGWLLLARDKTGRVGLASSTPTISDLVVWRSKDSYGQTITRFVDKVVLMGAVSGGLFSTGDAHYCSAVADLYSGQVQIYTYAECVITPEATASTFVIGVWRIEAYYDYDQGLRVRLPDRVNLLPNGDFSQGGAGYDLFNANAAIVTDTDTGRPILRITNTLIASPPSVFCPCKKGDTLFPKLRMRTNSTNLANGRHLIVQIFDFSTGSSVLLRSEYIQLLDLNFFGQWMDVLLRPLVSPGHLLWFRIYTETGITAAESDIASIDVSDCYQREPLPAPRLPDTVMMADVAFPMSPTGGAKASGTYSNAFWNLFGVPRQASNLPYPAIDESRISITLTDCTTNSGAVRCVCTSVVANSDGTVTAHCAVAPGESGTMTATVTAKAMVVIRNG